METSTTTSTTNAQLASFFIYLDEMKRAILAHAESSAGLTEFMQSYPPFVPPTSGPEIILVSGIHERTGNKLPPKKKMNKSSTATVVAEPAAEPTTMTATIAEKSSVLLDATAPPAAPAPQCVAKKVTGERCTRKPKTGLDVCATHQVKDPQELTSSEVSKSNKSKKKKPAVAATTVDATTAATAPSLPPP